MSKAVEWRDIPSFEGYYQASSTGRIRNSQTLNILSEHHLTNGGYVKCSLYKDGRRYQGPAHRRICEAYHGEGVGLEVNHKNGIKRDNRPENLEWVSRRDNIIHSLYELGNICQPVIAKHSESLEWVIFASIEQATRMLKLNPKSVSKCINGRLISSHGWSFVRYSKNSSNPCESYTIAPTTQTDHAEELAKALEPFANYDCDGELDPNHCYNCAAKHTLTNYREATE